MQALPTVTLTGGPQTAQLPDDVQGGGCLKLVNESPYSLRIAVSTGAERLLPAWTADVWPLARGASGILRITPTLVLPSQQVLTSQLLLEWAPPGEQVPGIWPMALPRQVQAFQQWTAVGTHVAGAGADSFTTLTVPSGTIALGIAVEGQGAFEGLGVVGHQSGTIYLSTGSASPAPIGSNWLVVPVNGLIDTSFDLSWLALVSGAGKTVAVFATTLPSGMPGLGQSLSGLSLPVVLASDQSAPPWAIPTQVINVVVNALASTGVQTLLAGVLGQTIRLYTWSLQTGAAAAAANNEVFRLESDGSTQIVASGGTTAKQWWDGDGRGVSLPSGEGLRIRNNDTVAHSYRGYVAVSQSAN